MTHTDFIPYGRQSISEDDIAGVVKALRSDFLTQGPYVTEFEQALASKVGANYGVAANSATSALHLACLALGVGERDTVWTSPNTFIASANCARYCGATVDFVDIDPKTYNLCVKKLAVKLAIAKDNGNLPKVIIPVHFAGQSCDMETIYKLSKQYGFRIIEDASHAIGAKYQDSYIGGGQFSDICIFSFHPVKIITSAEGGMAITNDATLAKHMKTHSQQGITKSPDELTQTPGDWYYEQHSLGFNYRMTELQAALGMSQLFKLDDFVTERHAQFARYSELLKDSPLTLPFQSDQVYSSLHLFPVLLPEAHKKNRKAIFDALRQANIGTQVHYIPVHTQPYYQNLGFKLGQFQNSEDYYQDAISIPLFHTMTETQQNEVITALSTVLST